MSRVDNREGIMKRYPFLRFAVLPLVLLLVISARTDAQPAAGASRDNPNLYFGQPAPGKTAVKFAEGIVSTDGHEFAISFTPDGRECFFSRQIPDVGNRVVWTHLTDEGWSELEPAPVAGDYEGFEPILSPDGNTLVYQSFVPDPETGQVGMHQVHLHRTQLGWGQREIPGLPFNPGRAMYASMTSDGTVYTTDISKGFGDTKIVCSRLVDGVYQPFEVLPDRINAAPFTTYPFISADESYMIYTMKNFPYPVLDGLYLTYRDKNGDWTKPQKIDTGLESPSMPFVTADGKYLFMTQINHETDTGDIYWMDAGFIEEGRAAAVGATR